MFSFAKPYVIKLMLVAWRIRIYRGPGIPRVTDVSCKEKLGGDANTSNRFAFTQWVMQHWSRIISGGQRRVLGPLVSGKWCVGQECDRSQTEELGRNQLIPLVGGQNEKDLIFVPCSEMCKGITRDEDQSRNNGFGRMEEWVETETERPYINCSVMGDPCMRRVDRSETIWSFLLDYADWN